VKPALLVSLVVVGACGGAAARPTPPPAPAPAPAASPFAFHHGFWLSLHLRLYGESGPRGPRDPLDDPTWLEAVAAYKAAFPQRDMLALLADDALVAAERVLADVPDDGAPSGIDPVLAAALAHAAPVYRARRWPDDRARAEAWIAAVTPLVAAHGAALAATIGETYHDPWPSEPVRVEVVPYAGFVGAYTVVQPTLIAVSSRDDRNHGDAALEILFHEASHARVGPLRTALRDVCPTAPPTLWHALLFYSTGEVVKRRLGPSYVPYAEKNGLWERAADWRGLLPIFRAAWQPTLDGARPFDEGVRRVCDSVLRIGSQPPARPQ
jgi:hypothetical protein